jgi:hypothetical protein
MSHFAKVENGIVTEVIVAEQDVIDSGIVGDPSLWVQTSYNTFGGEHRLGGTPLRKNYAGKGWTYDSQRDAFIPPKPYASWLLDEATCCWNPPVPIPTQTEGTFTPYKWDEATVNWVVDETALRTNVVVLGSSPDATNPPSQT